MLHPQQEWSPGSSASRRSFLWCSKACGAPAALMFLYKEPRSWIPMQIVPRSKKDRWSSIQERLRVMTWALGFGNKEGRYSASNLRCFCLCAVQQNVVKLKSDPDKGGQPKRQHSFYWCESTFGIVLNDSPSFKKDGTSLLVFPSVSTHLSSDCWWINHSLPGFSFGWRILSLSQKGAWSNLRMWKETLHLHMLL